mmetsp:Transcript_2644/g.10244  ORF Transcript_2644/g.10244 Transcript_2644/m.10244 type:complete len:118 (-) Transcript_2644:70-423(-)
MCATPLPALLRIHGRHRATKLDTSWVGNDDVQKVFGRDQLFIGDLVTWANGEHRPELIHEMFSSWVLHGSALRLRILRAGALRLSKRWGSCDLSRILELGDHGPQPEEVSAVAASWQ